MTREDRAMMDALRDMVYEGVIGAEDLGARTLYVGSYAVTDGESVHSGPLKAYADSREEAVGLIYGEARRLHPGMGPPDVNVDPDPILMLLPRNDA